MSDSIHHDPQIIPLYINENVKKNSPFCTVEASANNSNNKKFPKSI